MINTTSYPEVNALNSVKDCRAALSMGYNNFDSVKDDFKPELKGRLEAIEDRMRRLIATEKQIKATKRIR